MKKQKTTAFWRTFFRLVMIAALLGALSGAALADVLPAGEAVVGGAASFDRNVANVLTVNQATEKAAINWATFDVAANHTVNFVQPSVNSITLNNVLSGSLSTIAGNINANGQIFLCNPNGLVFSSGSQVNVGGLMASGRSSMNAAGFMNGSYILNENGNNSGWVEAHGEISAANYAVLVGNSVLVGNLPGAQATGSLANGTITVANDNGKIILVNSPNVTFNINGNKLVSYTATSVDNSTGLDIFSGAVLTANGVNSEIILDAGASTALLNSVISNSGTISANSIAESGGVIKLINANTISNTAVGGSIDAPTVDLGFIGDCNLNPDYETHWLTGGKANMTATGNIFLDGIAATSGVTLRAGGWINVGPVSIGNGYLNINCPSGNLTVGSIAAQDVTISAAHINSINLDNVTGSLMLETDTINTADWQLAADKNFSGNVTLTTTSGDITLNGMTALFGDYAITATSAANITVAGGIAANNINLLADGDITINSGASTSGTTTIVATTTDLVNGTASGFLYNNGTLYNDMGGNLFVYVNNGSILGKVEPDLTYNKTGAANYSQALADKIASGQAGGAYLYAGGASPDLPAGENVTGGGATFDRSVARTLNIQQNSAAVNIDWSTFDISAGYTVNFAQPSVNSIAVNNVVGGNPSLISGNVSSNGKIFIYNTNGILFGAGSQVNVGGLDASTAYHATGVTGSMAGSAVSNSSLRVDGTINTVGDLSLTSTGPFTLSGALTSGGSLTIGANNDITLNTGASINAHGTLWMSNALNYTDYAQGKVYNSGNINADGLLLVYEQAGGWQPTPAPGYLKIGARPLGSALTDMNTYVANKGGKECVYFYDAAAREQANFNQLINSSIYGDTMIFSRMHNPATGYSVTDPVTGAVVNVSGTPIYTNQLDQHTGTGNYNTTYISGLSADYYAISGPTAQFAVTPATLTVTANSTLRLIGYNNPQFSASYNGFVNGDGPSVLDPQVQFSTTANKASGAGRYAITPYGAGSPNYEFNYVNGTLTVVGATPSGGNNPVPGLQTLSASADSNNNSNDGTEEDDNSGNGMQRSRLMRGSALPMAAVAAVGNTINPVENADYNASHYNIEPAKNVQQRVAWIRTRGKCCLKPPCDARIPVC